MQNLSFRQDGCPANQPRLCDICQMAACTIYCQNETAYLCHGCDEFIHSSNAAASLHEGLLNCNACEIALATFVCQSYGASLCINCDIDLHLANPLACCNNRASEPPFPELTSSTTCLEDPQAPMLDMENYQIISDRLDYEELNNEMDSWFVFDLGNNEQEIEYVNLLEKYSYTQYQDQGQDNQHQISSFDEGNIGNVTLFPAQFFETDEHQQPEKLQQEEEWRQQQHLQEQPPPQQQQNDHFNKYEATKTASIETASSQKDQVSMCFPDSGDLTSATTGEISVSSLSRTPEKATDPSPKPLQLVPFPFSSTNREAKVLRYREKRNARKFDKKIRYASRKANAETRPRLKGRFVRKTAVLCEMDQMSIAEEYMYAALVRLSS